MMIDVWRLLRFMILWCNTLFILHSANPAYSNNEVLRDRASDHSLLSRDRPERDLHSGKPKNSLLTWVTNPYEPGDNLPAKGRSMFDTLFAVDRNGNQVSQIPFPFTALVKQIQSRSNNASIKQVLIPMGRSLQRSAAAPEFFKYPRVVLAVDGEGQYVQDSKPVPLLKDRLYIGYQEKANILEVISYNETQGRFEFQLVKDYRQGGDPKVFYANRAICISCHQNAAPIFSRQVWGETNGNSKVSFLLNKIQPVFYGVRVNRGIDIPNAIDDAKLRANLLALYQSIWKEGCGGDDSTARQCRAGLFTAALRYKLSGEKSFPRTADYQNKVVIRIMNQAKLKWPNGLAIGNPDIPNRDPIPGESGLEPSLGTMNMLLGKSPDQNDKAQLNQLINVSTEFDPLMSRPPLEVWSFKEGYQIDRVVEGLAGFLSSQELSLLSKGIVEKNIDSVDKIIATLAESSSFDGFSNKPFRRDVLMKALFQQLYLARTQFAVLNKSGGMRCEASIVPHCQPTASDRQRSNAPAGGRAKAQIVTAQGIDVNTTSVCCEETATLSPTVMESMDKIKSVDATRNPALGVFYKHCAMCHQTPEKSPPNFLAGDVRQVRDKLSQCAERILVRLSMWHHPDAAKLKSPMPPVLGLRSLGYTEDSWKRGSDLAELKLYVEDVLQQQTGTRPDVNLLLNRGYENLRTCLPPIH